MADTEVRDRARRTKGARSRSIVQAVLPVLALIVPVVAAAASASHRVLWTRADHVYVALAENGSAAAGDSVRFEEKKRAIAGGVVTEVVRGEVAVVTLTSGSFAHVKKLERVRVTMTRGMDVRRPLLRVGLPQRNSLLVSSAPAVPTLPHLPPPWPDTLIVSYFTNATDEEIALERGDVDVAVFWPGELSRRMREDARWKGSPLGRRSRGVVAIAGADLVPAGLDSASAHAFNEDLFRGDLEWTGFAVGRPATMMGLTVDERIPGAATIGEWLARRFGRPRAIGGRITVADVPADTAAAPGFQPLFRLRCPVVSGPAWRQTVDGIGPGVFADLPAGLDAGPANRR